MKRLFLITIFSFLFSSFFVWNADAQIGNYLGDESDLYAATKQMNQFFRRFNHEEDKLGKKYDPFTKAYRDNTKRAEFVSILFDGQNKTLNESLKKSFIGHVTNPSKPIFLEFHGGEWFAEVTARFVYEGKEQDLILFLKLQEEKVGSKWVISNVYFPPFSRVMGKDVQDSSKFLHPLSHELSFMNLRKAFNADNNIKNYVERDFKTDYVSLFIYEVNQKNLRFRTITNVKFHFFQIKDWYFEVSNFNRKGYNSGWLISNVMRLTDDTKTMLLKYIYAHGQ